jgi:hypothetical protein
MYDLMDLVIYYILGFDFKFYNWKIFADFQVVSPPFNLFCGKLPSRTKLSMILDQNAFYNVPRAHAFYLIKIGPLVLK